ncbi:unnamed protein product [Cylicocyclus nassatus]|uniref:Uncharacterized protein n=1 Tax=Cylicocyclus nassatus TaxID=53992 RepID=A0AA36GI55_CYLNA|nr:unnamed protein product [Cylicocyclus nassatus]
MLIQIYSQIQKPYIRRSWGLLGHSPGCGYRGIRYFRDSIVLPAIQTRRDHPLITRGIILACYFFTQFFHRSHRFMQFAVPAISYTVPCIDPSSRLHVEGDINS